jgi:hypothetical protein
MPKADVQPADDCRPPPAPAAAPAATADLPVGDSSYRPLTDPMTPAPPAAPAQQPGQVVPLFPSFAALAPANYLGTRVEIQAELDNIAQAIRMFHLKQPDQVMREVAAYTARCTELCVLLHRVESTDRQYTRIRTQQVERFLSELQHQFKVASRLVEVMRQDIDVMRGAT